MNQPTKVAVIGVGRFGRHHARVYHELPEAELVGVYDRDAARSAEAGITIIGTAPIPQVDTGLPLNPEPRNESMGTAWTTKREDV